MKACARNNYGATNHNATVNDVAMSQWIAQSTKWKVLHDQKHRTGIRSEQMSSGSKVQCSEPVQTRFREDKSTSHDVSSWCASLDAGTTDAPKVLVDSLINWATQVSEIQVKTMPASDSYANLLLQTPI